MINLPDLTTNLDSMARRTFIRDSAMGLGSIALASILQSEGYAGDDALKGGEGVLKELHVAPRAKRVIFLFMAGGPSHVDLFDPKPLLQKNDGKQPSFPRTRVTFAKRGNLLA